MAVKLDDPEMAVDATPATARRSIRPRFLYTGLAVAAIWLAAAAASIWTPDMITGSMHEHLPIAAFSLWLYATIATAFVVMAASAGGRDRRGRSLAVVRAVRLGRRRSGGSWRW